MSEQLNDLAVVPGVTEDFKVDNLDIAAWTMRKYRALAQRLEANKRLAEAEKNRIEAWLERTNAPIEGRMEWFEDHLRAYALARRAEDQKSISLPDGEVKTRKSPPTFQVDKAVFVEWAQEQKRDDVLRVSVSPDMTGIKGAFIADGGNAIDPASGEIVPGLMPVPEQVIVSLAPDMDANDLDEEADDE
jgi:hypothetical protein